MKRTLWIFSILLWASALCAQNHQTTTDNGKKDEDFVCVLYEQNPYFPGGDTALLNYIHQHLRYPEAAKNAGIEGRVLVQFVVETDGSLSNFHIFKSAHPLLDEEAIRVLKSMPNWIPGKLGHKTVRLRYTMPVTFKLELNQVNKNKHF